VTSIALITFPHHCLLWVYDATYIKPSSARTSQ